MAVKSIDFKDIGMKYGERIGLGVGLVFMLFLIFRAFMLEGSSVTPEKVKKDEAYASQRVENSAVVQDKLVPPGTISTKAISDLAITVMKAIKTGSLSNPFAGMITFPSDDIFRNQPKVFAPDKLVAEPTHLAFRVREVRPDANGDLKVLIVTNPELKKLETKPPPKENRREYAEWMRRKEQEEKQRRWSEQGRRGPGFGGLGGGRGKAPGAPPGFPGMPSAPGQQQMAAAKERWQGEYIPLNQLKPEHVLAEHILPARGALIYGSFPHKAQMEEIARQVKEDVTRLPLYYKAVEIQRREIVLKGTRLPDGTFAQQDLVRMPVDRSLKPLADVPADPATPEEEEAAGWMDLDNRLMGVLIKLAIDFDEEDDSHRRSLMELSTGLVMELPKPLRGKYPDLIPKLPELEKTLKLIKDEYADKLPIPPRDPRLRSLDDEFDPFKKGGGIDPKKPDANQPPKETGPSEAVFPGNTMLRFLDLQFADGPPSNRTFEYRVRVVLSNPNYLNPSVSVPDFARDPELRGDWSPPERLTFPEETYLYADERQRDPNDPNKNDYRNADRVPVQIVKWLGICRRLGISELEERVGEWWVDRVMAYRGEQIGVGRVANEPPVKPVPGQPIKPSEAVKLIVWFPTLPDPETRRMGTEKILPVNTDALYTKTLLVDFNGGRWTRHTYKRFFDEDAPAELLLVDPVTGTMTARTQLQDRNDAERLAQFSRWEPWFKSAMKRYEEELKALQSPNKDKFGLGDGGGSSK